MAPPRPNTPSRRRPSQSTKAGPQPEVETEAESSAPRAKTPHRRHHDQVTQTEPEAEIENTETVSSRALTAWHNRRPSRSSEADADAEAEKQLEKPAQPDIPTKTPGAPRQWALYFAKLVRSLFILSLCFFSTCTLPSTYPFPHSFSSPPQQHAHRFDIGLRTLQQRLIRLPIALLPSVNPRV